MQSFWKKLPKPFFALAPMADVTDASFRRIIAKYSRYDGKDVDQAAPTPFGPGKGPDVFWTEFVSADGLMSPGREVLRHDLEFTEAERPIVAQLFSAHPDKMEGAARLCAELGFDGIDINMGCPDKSIEKQGAGAAMIKNPEIAQEIIRAAKRGAPGLPVSVKTRIGYNKNQIEEWIPILLGEDIAALTIHCRTRKEMSKVPARWEHVKEVVALRDAMGKDTLIIGNGDVKDIADARAKAAETGCDGVMLGRAIFGNPWLFDQARGGKRFNLSEFPRLNLEEPSLEERLRVLVEHSKLYEELLGKVKSFAIMKKHFKAYVNGFPEAKELRDKLMFADDAKGVETLINNFLKK